MKLKKSEMSEKVTFQLLINRMNGTDSTRIDRNERKC